MKTYTIGDIHGAYKALIQCLKRSKFNYSKDTLIVLGDVCDGWNQVPECIEELIKIKNLIYIWGNHDDWTNRWFQYSWKDMLWLGQGGIATKEAYERNTTLLEKHRNFFKDNAKFYHLDTKNRLFVHGGLNLNNKLTQQDPNDLMWDRELFEKSRYKHWEDSNYKFGDYHTIFLGHTSTEGVNDDRPLKYCNVWNLDQGAGWSGKLTIMDVNTEEYWQSDNVLKFYPDIRGRR